MPIFNQSLTLNQTFPGIVAPYTTPDKFAACKISMEFEYAEFMKCATIEFDVRQISGTIQRIVYQIENNGFNGVQRNCIVLFKDPGLVPQFATTKETEFADTSLSQLVEHFSSTIVQDLFDKVFENPLVEKDTVGVFKYSPVSSGLLVLFHSTIMQLAGHMPGYNEAYTIYSNS